MTYQFDVETATKYGVDAAIMLYNLAFWIKKNKANRKHEHDGYYWTYNSARAFEELFPFWNAQKIRRMLVELEEAGVIASGNFNTNPYDRTKWYTIIDPVIGQNDSVDSSKMNNGSDRNEECSSYTDSKPDRKLVGEEPPEKKNGGDDRPPVTAALQVPEIDPLLQYYRRELSKRLPATSWPNVSNQAIALRSLVVMTRETQPQTAVPTPEQFAELVVEHYEKLKRQNSHAYWKRAPFDPINVERRFADVVQAIAAAWEADNEEPDEFMMAALKRSAGR